MIVDLPPGHPVQALSDAVRWVIITQTPVGLMVGERPPPRLMISDSPLGEIAAGLLSSPDAMAFPSTSLIVLGPQPASLVRTAELAGARARLNASQEAQVHLMVHEHLHMTAAGAEALGAGRESAVVEEAAVDAVAGDLVPQVVRSLTGRVMRDDAPLSYPECVRTVRVASTVATGSGTWRDAAAASWRMRLLMAPPVERVAMLARTGTGTDVCS